MKIDAEPTMSEGDRARRRTYHREFFPGILLYVVAVFATAALVGDDPSIPRRLLLLIPLVPALWSARAIVRSLGRADEFERLVQLESMAIGFGFAMVGAITIGSLGMHAEPNRFNQMSPWLIYSIGMVAWGITVAIRTRRNG